MSELVSDTGNERHDAARTAASRRAERIRRAELAEAREKLGADSDLSEAQTRWLAEFTERLTAALLPDGRVDPEVWELFVDGP